MADEKRAVDEVFEYAVRLTGRERDAYLHDACEGDSRLRQRVEQLLWAAREAGSFLENCPAARPTEPATKTAHIGQVIGPYKLREMIGEGGMGAVYVAEQEKPLRRKVALKVIKAGMDSKAIIARFEAERNALAMMNHPSKVMFGDDLTLVKHNHGINLQLVD